ncbi:MAG: thioredoxin-dependent thiol peroxidase [Bacteroidetes bacterium]|nr:thioredoxin-dependent thiol peroxidase [Bacteroidota bacterium]
MAENLTFLAVGTAAPDFKVADQDGKLVSLKDFKGKKVVLYFYPQDNTPTCTKEACNLRDNHALLTERGFVVLGVSADSEKAHQKFIQKFDLPFALLADTEHEIIKKYNVWGEKTTFGKTYDGIHRTTYIIDEKGKIAHVIHPVESGRHAEQVLELYA